MVNEKLIYASAARGAILRADPRLSYLIDNIKGVDAVEVVHGRWLNAQIQAHDPFGYYTHEVDVFTCSVCGVQFDVSECRNYCPNCGAKMDGDGNGT